MQLAVVCLLANVASCLAEASGLVTQSDPGTCSSPAALGSRGEAFRSSAARFERFWSLDDYEHFLGGAGSSDAADGQRLGLRHVLFVVKASRANADMVLRMERVWLHAASNRIFLVDDLIDGLPEAYQIVMSTGRPNPDGDLGRADPVTTSRILIWLHQAKVSYDMSGLSADTRWVVLLGDDVFVNLARLYYFLVRYPASDHPVMFAHVLSDTEVYDFDMPCFESGAVILNKQAVDSIGQFASCKECPYVGSDAISLSFCSFFSAVPLVHVPGMHCHAQHLGEEDHLLTSDLLSHHWIAAGGLSASALAASATHLTGQLAYHPFDADFPNLDCKLPSGDLWTFQELSEKVAFCSRTRSNAPLHAASQSAAGQALSDGDELSSSNADALLNSMPSQGWSAEMLREALYGDSSDDERAFRRALTSALASGLEDARGRWLFLRAAGTWVHRAEAARFLEALHASGTLDLQGNIKLLFAFVNPATATIEAGAGFLLSTAAALALASSAKQAPWPLSAGALGALGVTLVHTPLMIPDAAALPRGLRGIVSAGAVSGVWSVGQVRSDDTMDELEALVQERSFFKGLLSQNFADWARNAPACGLSDRDSHAWMRFLHDDDEHIKAVRAFQGGRREFRTLHAMYRSETSYVLPLHGISPDTVLVARDCTSESDAS